MAGYVDGGSGGGGGLTDIIESAAAGYVALSVTTLNAAFVLAPNGTGAFQLQIADSGIGGGNVRGTNAVDLQMSRVGATEVASGTRSATIGGENNSATNTNAGNFCGIGNIASGGRAVTVGGNTNLASGTQSAALGGNSSTVSGLGAAIAGTNSCVNFGQNAFSGGGLSCDISAGGIRGATLGGQNSQVTAASAIATGHMALADHPTTFVVSGNSETPDDTQRGKSQIQILHIDQRTTDATKTPLDSIGTEFTVPLNGTISLLGKATAHNETDGTSTDWVLDILAKNIAGTVTIIRGSGTPIAQQSTDDAGTPALDVVVSGSLLRFDGTGIVGKDFRWSGGGIVWRSQA